MKRRGLDPRAFQWTRWRNSWRRRLFATGERRFDNSARRSSILSSNGFVSNIYRGVPDLKMGEIRVCQAKIQRFNSFLFFFYLRGESGEMYVQENNTFATNFEIENQFANDSTIDSIDLVYTILI